MNTTKLMTIGLILIGLFGLSGMATATVTTADGNDGVYFAGEAITLSWTGSGLYTYVWVTNDSGNLSNSSAYCIGSPTTGMKLTAVSSYVLNTSINCTSSGTYWIYVNKTNNGTSPTIDAGMDNTYLLLNDFSVAVSPDYNNFGVFSGDNATVIITTTGDQPASQRILATFTVATNESGVTPVMVSSDATSGNITYKIPVSATAGTYNVTVSNGAAKDTSGIYAVRTFNIKAADRTVSTNATSVTLEALDANGNAANYSTSSGTDAVFNLTISGKSDDVWNATTSKYIITAAFPVNANTSTVAVNLTTGATTGTATITATCQNYTLSDSATYTDHAAAENITITSIKHNGTATTTFNVDQNVTITGWINNASAVILNITNGTSVVANLAATPAANGTWTVDWNTSTSTLYNTGTYTILAWKNGSVNNSENATTTITLNDAIAITSTTSIRNGSTLTDVVYADGNLTINGTSTRADGATVTVNVTNANGYTSATTATVTNGTFSSTWVATGITAAGTYTVKVNDSLVSASKTITVNNNLTINAAPTTGPTGSNVTISGTSTRTDGTVIYLSATDAYSFSVMPSYANATVSGGNWSYNWSTVNTVTSAALATGAYTVKANDTISTTTRTITLDTGSISSVAAAPASVFLDDAVNITGATSFPAGTTVDVNITNCAGVSINTTTATVASDQTFLATFTPNVALANIKANTSIASGTATLCAVANINAISGSTNFTIKDNITLTTAASAVTGEQVMLTGTSSRQNTTAINITVSLANYAVTEQTTVSGGTFTNNTYYATTNGLSSGGTNLPAGTYTINATDGIVSVTKTLTIGTTGVIQITAPTEDQNISIGTNFMIQGTSNRVNGTGVNITITGQNATKLTATVNELGVYNTTWNTTGYAAGYFYINAQHVVSGVLTDSSVTVRVILTTATTTTTTTTINGTTTTSTTTSTTTTTSPAGTVVINEFVSAAGVTDEWIELYNKGGVDVNLSGWTIENRAAATNTSKRIPLSGTIPALGYKVLNQSIELTYGDLIMSLSDDGDIIVLRNASTTIIDQVAYGDYNSPANTTNAPAASFTTPRSSTGRYPNGVDTGVDSADFIIFSTPTPGASNGPTTTTTTTSTTTTTLGGTCVMPGNSAPCNAVSLAEVVAAVNAWSTGSLSLGDVIDLINSWADPTGHPAQ